MADTDTLLRFLILVGLFILIIPLLMMSFMMLMGTMMGPMGSPTIFGIVPLLLALGIGYGGYRLLKRDTETNDEVPDGDIGPVEHLKKQYTNGEITESEFEQKLDQHFDNGSPSETTSETSVDTTREYDSEFEH